MKRPMVWGTIFVGTGIVLGQYDLSFDWLRGLDGSWSNDLGIVLFYALFLLLVCLYLYKQLRYKPVFLLILFGVAGLGRVGYEAYTSPVIPKETSIISLSGTVQDVGRTRAGYLKITIRTENPFSRNAFDRPIQVMAYLKAEQQAEIGQVVSLTGRLLPLEPMRNPGGYDERLALGSRKIDAKIFPETLEVQGMHMNLTVLLNRFKERLIQVYDTALPEREAAVMKSIILGDKAGLDDDIRSLYQIGGIYHILCVSGLHVSILLMATHFALNLCFSKRTAGIIALVLMILYCLLTGTAVSTVRAVTMCAVLVFAPVFFRDYDLLSSVSLACTALLLYEPLYLWNVGFQLSFGAVFGVAVLREPTEHVLALLHIPLPVKIKQFLAANIAVTAATFPILSYHFAYLTPYSLFVNLIVLPTASLLVVAGLLAGLAGLVSTTTAMFLSGVLFYLLRFYESVCRFFASLPFSVVWTGSCGMFVFAASFAVLLAYAFTFSGFGSILKRRLVFLYAALSVFVICIGIKAMPLGLSFTVLDVGEGDAYVLQYRGQTILIGGEPQSNSFNVDAFLTYTGALQVDGLWVLGTTEKHLAGAITLVAQNRVGTLYVPCDWAKGGEWVLRLVESAQDTDTPVVLLESGDTLTYGELSLTAGENFELTIQGDYGNFSLHIAGINASTALENTDVLLLGHGLSNREVARYAETFPYSSVIVSEGFSYAPKGRMLQNALHGSNIPVYSTLDNGAVTLKIQGENMIFSPMVRD